MPCRVSGEQAGSAEDPQKKALASAAQAKLRSWQMDFQAANPE